MRRNPSPTLTLTLVYLAVTFAGVLLAAIGDSSLLPLILGAAIALALRPPELLASMVLLSANFHRDALLAENTAVLDAVTAPDGPLAEDYAQRSPGDRDHWPIAAARA